MNKVCKERREGRTHVRTSGLTLQAAVQLIEASRPIHAGQRPFARLLRCRHLKGLGLPARRRLANDQNSAARRGKINWS